MEQVVVSLPTVEKVFEVPAQIIDHAVIDEYGEVKAELAKKMEKLEPLIAKVALLEASIIEAADSVAEADEEVTFKGAKFSTTLSAKGIKTTVTDKTLLQKLLTPKVFFELAEIGITKCKQYLTPPELEQVLKEEHVNKRRIKVSHVVALKPKGA